MCPRLIPAAFGAASCPAAGMAKAAARRKTDAIEVFIADTVLGIRSQRKIRNFRRTRGLEWHIGLGLNSDYCRGGMDMRLLPLSEVKTRLRELVDSTSRNRFLPCVLVTCRVVGIRRCCHGN